MTNVVKMFEKASIDDFKEGDNGIEYIRNCLEHGFKSNIIITGGVGTGKTHLAYSILNKMEKKYSYISKSGREVEFYGSSRVCYASIKEIIDAIRALWKNNSDYNESIIKDAIDADILIIDEVGVQYGSDSERIELFDIFDKRWADKRPIIAISNLSVSQIEKVLGQRIIDRLKDGAKIIQFSGKSLRKIGEEK